MPVAPPCSGRSQRPCICTSCRRQRREINAPEARLCLAYFPCAKRRGPCVLSLLSPNDGWRYAPGDTGCQAHSALRADSSTLTPGSGAGPWRACGVRAPFDHFPLVIDHPISRVPDAPHLHLCTTVGTAEGIAPRALLVPLPVR